MYTQARANGYLPAIAFTRKARIVIDDGGYHFKTRGGKLIGPFPSELSAIKELNKFVLDKEMEINSFRANHFKSLKLDED